MITIKHIERYARASIIVCSVISAISWSYVAGMHSNLIAEAYNEPVITKVTKPHAVIMDKIAQCESGNSHIDKKTGQVLMRGNTNKTVDVGKYQINSVWYKKASELGYDITKEADNEAMAYWIFFNRGSGDWKYSESCWKR